MGIDDSNPLSRGVVEERLTRVLGERSEAAPASREGLRSAAVGIVLSEEAGPLQFLLTMRPAGMRRHANQFALPGGRVDEGETVEATVVRELEEELGLRLTQDAVIGRMPDYDTRSGFRITPLVLWVAQVGKLSPSADEVAAVYRIPVTALTGPGVPVLVHIAGSEKPMIQVPLGGDKLIHAPTGAILYQFGQAVLAERYVDANGYEEPRFAWR
jgi:8-oxo-dGTP pyrophosphatase MutT (NUDIX family)